MWTGKHTAILGAASVASLSAGCASGWFLAQRVLAKKFDLRLEEEIRQTRAFYQNLDKPDPEKLAEELLEEEAPPQKHQYDTTSDEVPTEVLERVAKSVAAAQVEMDEEAKPMKEKEHNAFENPLPAWNQQDQELERRNGVPYIISQDEFYENKWEFTEGHLTYYVEDDTLTDSRDEPILDQYAAVGETSLDEGSFGFGSRDPNTVHVCNEQMEMIFEICRSTKSYREDVLGFVDGGTLQHGVSRSRRRQPEWDG